ncbi:hypothetical protein [Micromonospora carbonacea]|uniref:DUF2637 domain-containing protein n=1 Tax=Micromonospora carbonacea TaxID=47853 RepID=A0A1C4X0I7_9ACTN|nr:hypothetical protein [Micromonospora carbonacea]SCF01975.1 hypothetical protein GA0070563_104148 [Micromonospora carbonacea]
MKLLTRSPKLTPADLAELRRIELTTQIEHARQAAQLHAEQDAADRAARRQADREAARVERKRRKAAAKARARRVATLRRYAETARYVAPLLLVNTAAVGAQTGYAFSRTPESWPTLARVAVALVYAATVESISLYVNWHSHDALMQGATGTAAEMRRRAYLIAAIVGAMNYSHFDGEGWTPTPFAVGTGMASLLSPWLWGLHTRRQQHLQLLRRDLVDETGATFDRRRRRAFPIRTWRAARWSIEHNELDPKAAWAGYHAQRDARRAAAPGGRIRAAWRALLGTEPTPAQPEPAAPEPAQPAPVEPLDLDDPGVLAIVKAKLDVAAARERILPGAIRYGIADRDPARFAALAAGGLWDMVEATDEPAHVRRPTPPRVANAPAEPPAPAAEPEPTPAVSREPERPAAELIPAGSEPAPREPGYRVDVDRLATEYDRLVRETGRKPKGEELGAAAGCSKATANRWMRDQAQRPTQ